MFLHSGRRSLDCAVARVTRFRLREGRLNNRFLSRRRNILTIKPTKCTNFSNLFLEQNSTCFGQVFCPSSGVQHCIHSNGVCVIQYLTPDDEQRNCPKHVEFYSKNKFEKLVHLVSFITRIYHDARSSECQRKDTFFPQNIPYSP